MSKKTFEHYVNLIIVDASISVCDNTDFSSYNRFSNYISENIIGKNYGALEGYLLPILNEVSYILGLPVVESAHYVAKFFKTKKWEQYHGPVKAIKDEFSIFLVP